jgi:2,4-dienoyl-CoA reductase-like NADH-dependent reductase (Old Yellow Enzyme family)/thioredoxin reductase/putative sterol carrier protein
MTLLTPFRLKHLTLRNRIVMPGMDTNFGDEEGNTPEKAYRYYELRAKGGAGLIIVEAAYFDKRGAGTQNMLSLESNRRIPQFARLNAVIKKHGARTLLQIYHAGSQATSFMIGLKPVAPSDVPFQMSGEVPTPLTVRGIRKIVRGYARACRRAKRAGFDGVEIHAGHGYLLNQFFSPLTNRRDDAYGGGFENRSRLHVQVLRALRRHCGQDFVIGFRINGSDYIEGGTELAETCKLARRLEQEGVDLINITGGIFDSPGFPVVPYMNYPRGVFAEAAGKVKSTLERDTPVCVVGRINTQGSAEQILQEGKADLVALGRALIADPDFPKKTAEGRSEEIRPCIACNACLNQIMTEQPVACAVNPDLIGEAAEIQPAPETRRVLIAGAGIAGLEAARVAALRGHKVTLIDASDHIGGAADLAAAAPMKAELALLRPFYERALRKLRIDLRLNTPLSPGIVEELQPDTVVLAVGSEPEVPAIEGLSTCSHSFYPEVLAGTIPSGDNIVVLGGGMIGIDVADLLSPRNKAVTIVEPGKRLGADLYALVGREMEKVLGENPRIRICLKTEAKRIEGNSLICDQKGESVTIPFDHLVVAFGRIPARDLSEGIGDRVAEVLTIGDARQPGLILDAVHGAYAAALSIGAATGAEKIISAAQAAQTARSADARSVDLAEGETELKSRVARKIKSGTFGLEDVPEYLDVLVAACNAHPKIQKKSKKAMLVFQFEIEGGADFWIRIDRGVFSTGPGTSDRADVTIRMDRRIAPGIFSGKVNAASAYMAKELSFVGPMKHGIAFRTWVNIVRQELGL